MNRHLARTVPPMVDVALVTRMPPTSAKLHWFCHRVPRLACLNKAVVTGMFVCIALTMAETCLAQSTTSLRGTVTDPSGSVVSGATVVVSDSQSKVERTVQTGSEGQYQFQFLSPGTYTLTVIAAGFAHYQQSGMQLLVNTPATANVQLKIGQATETIAVSGEAVAINTVDASVGNSFNQTQVVGVPLEGRNAPDLLSVQAGVAYTGNRSDIDPNIDTRSGSVNGARSDQSNLTLDGVDVNDQGRGYAFTSVLPVTLDSVQEFRVTTTNYNAEQGTGSGAQVALVTKSGTDRFHGSLYEYTRNTVTSANDFFIKSAELANGQSNKPLQLIRNIFGGSVGGPILKNRLFFFLNYEGTRQAEQQSAVRLVPTATLRQGIVQYPNGSGGVTVLSPAQVTALDPLHLGPNPVMLANFNTYPLPNDNTQGDGGFNFEGYRFRAPIHLKNNVYIARFDYHVDGAGKHTLFWRGALQNLTNPQAPFLPGLAPQTTRVDDSKGFAVGYTTVLTNSMVNSFHYGLTRQSFGSVGDTNQPWNTIVGLSQDINYSQSFQTPVNNLIDDFSWTKGTHTLQFGTNLGFVRDPRQSTLSSFSNGSDTTGWMQPAGFANQPTSPLNPPTGGFSAVNAQFNTTYDNAMAALLGMVSDVNAFYNYDKNGNLLPQGAPVKRNFGLNWYEFYGQDSWRVKPNLTLTYGLRWSLFPPPWEVNGEEVAPSPGVGTILNENAMRMQQGMGYEGEPPIVFNLAGKANNAHGFYDLETHDFAPRIAFAYSQSFESGWLGKITGGRGKTSVRGGFGMVYDRAGMQIISSFDQFGAFGLTTQLQSAPALWGAAQLPRLTDLNVIPQKNVIGDQMFLPAPKGGFPFTPPAIQAVGFGVDNTLKTPYSYSLDLSVARELPNRFSLQVSYVGRLGRHLLTRRDMMPQLNVTDPKTGIDYYRAADALTPLARSGVPVSQITPALVGPTASYWTDMIQPLAPGGAYQTNCGNGPFNNPLQAVYDIFSCIPYVEVQTISGISYYGALYDANNPTKTYNFITGPFSYQQGQFGTYYGYSSIGNSNYNALQASLRKQVSRGVQFDINYTYSKSIDITSQTARVGAIYSGLVGNTIINPFSPNLNRGVSDFDTTHQFNADWLADLPFGRGNRFATKVGGLLDAVIGGWQITGIARWTSGFPVTVDNGNSWPTNWNFEGMGLMIAKPKTGVFRQPDGSVNMFADPVAAAADFVHYLPGQVGTRNPLRGPGFAGLDMGLSKRWRLPFEGHTLQFRWEVFNVPNLVRFYPQANNPTVGVNATFGTFSGLLTNPRVMQFALRYEF